MPLFKTKMMPASAARSSTRGLPPLGLGGSSGNNGSMVFHSSSDTSSLAITFPYPHQQVLKGSLSGEKLVDGEQDRPLVRGGRGGLRPSQRPLSQGGRARELPPRQDQRERRGRSRDGPSEDPLRDRTAAPLAPLLHHARRRARGCARREREDDPVPLQGGRFLPLGRGGRGAGRGSRLVLPRTHRRIREDQGPPLLLQREGRPRGRRRAAGTPPDAVVLAPTRPASVRA